MPGLKINGDSPFHQQVCVAGATVLGSAVGAFGGMGVASVQGALLGGAVGFILGEAICSWGPIDKTFKDAFDFESGLTEFEANNAAVSDAMDKLAAVSTVRSRAEAAIVLRFVWETAVSDPGRYYVLANERRGTRMTGTDLHGITTLANTAAIVLKSLKA